MKRNFEILKIGKYYTPAKFPNCPVLIVERAGVGLKGSDGRLYDSVGASLLSHPDYDLTVEVDLTIVPVEPPRPLSLWAIFLNGILSESFDTESDADDWVQENLSPDVRVRIIRMVEDTSCL